MADFGGGLRWRLCFSILKLAASMTPAPTFNLRQSPSIDEWKELGHFERKIQFDEAAASKEALEINHYDPEIWKKEAVPEATVVAGFDAFLARYRPFA